MLKTLAALGAVGAAAMLLVPTASQADETRSARISYADLNLASKVGQQVLERRIALAAQSMCDTDGVVDLNTAYAERDCRVATIANALPAFHAAVAQAYHPSVTVLGAASLIVTVH